MIKLIISTCLLLALSTSIQGHRDPDLTDEEWNLLLDEALDHHNNDDASCELNPPPPGQADIHLDIDIPDGGCSCEGSEEEEEDLCLGEANSKKISDALIEVLKKASFSYQAFIDLHVLEFAYNRMTYQDWAHEIKHSSYDYEGYEELRELVRKYRVCEKVCKVFFMFRKAILENTGNAVFEKFVEEDRSTLVITGEVLMLQDLQKEIEQAIEDDPTVRTVVFRVTLFVNDAFLGQEVWHGLDIFIETVDFVVAKDGFWDVTALTDDDFNPIEPDGSISVCDNTYWNVGDFAFQTYPDVEFVTCEA